MQTTHDPYVFNGYSNEATAVAARVLLLSIPSVHQQLGLRTLHSNNDNKRIRGSVSLCQREMATTEMGATQQQPV